MIYTWILIYTKGSLLLVLLFHAAGNITSNLMPILPPAATDLRIYYFTIAIHVLIVIGVILWSRDQFTTPKTIELKEELGKVS